MRRYLSKLLIFLCFSFLFQPLFIYALDYPKINSQILEIYDLTNQEVVYEVDSTKQTSIASLTKIVTTITAIENIPNLEEEVTITYDILKTVSWDASKAGLEVGDKLTYRDLLYASMLPSGADATNSIAISSSGSIDAFVQKMNDLVTKLKLKNTHFVNVTGLDEEGHYSTADEVRILLEYALSNDLFREIYTTREYTLSNGLVVKSTLIKYNAFDIVDTSKILGSKTGYTGEAGYCLSSLSNINSHEFIIIVLNAEHIDSFYYNIVDTVDTINFLLEHYNYQTLIHKGDLVQTIPIKFSKLETYQMKAKKDVTFYLPDDYDIQKLRIQYEGLDSLSFLNKKGDKIGTITYYYDNKKVLEEDFLLEKKIPISIQKIVKEYIFLFIGIPILLIILIIFRKKKKKKKNK